MVNVRNSFGDLDMIKLLILENKRVKFDSTITIINTTKHICNCSKCEIDDDEEFIFQCPHCCNEEWNCYKVYNDNDLFICRQCDKKFLHNVAMEKIENLLFKIKLKCSQ